jgi:hypothetical protein
MKAARYKFALTLTLGACVFSLPAFGQDGARNGAVGDGKKAAPPSVETPRTQDGKPDLSGMWIPASAGGNAFIIRKDEQGRTTVLDLAKPDPDFGKDDALGRAQRAAAPNQPPYKPELLGKVKFMDENTNKYDGALHCLPLGVPRMGAPRQILAYPGHLVFLYEGGESSINTFRVIPIDGSAHEADPDPSYLGDSVGTWEGDTLVVNAVGFTDRTWLAQDGKFHSDGMHVIERFTRDGNNLKYEVTVEDPNVFTRPWVMNPRNFKLNTNPKAMLEEEPPCIEEDASHLVTNEHH